MLQDDPIQIDRALERGEAWLREHLHPDPYIGEHPTCFLAGSSGSLGWTGWYGLESGSEKRAPCLHAPAKGCSVVLKGAVDVAGLAAHAVPYRPGGSMYARNPPYDPSIHIHFNFGREGGH
jgi:hypothetical protein